MTDTDTTPKIDAKPESFGDTMNGIVRDLRGDWENRKASRLLRIQHERIEHRGRTASPQLSAPQFLTGAARVWHRVMLNLAWLTAVSGMLLILIAASKNNIDPSLYDYDAFMDSMGAGVYEFLGWTSVGYAIVFAVIAFSIKRASLSDPSKP